MERTNQPDSPLKKVKDKFLEFMRLDPDDVPIIDYILSIFTATMHPMLQEVVWGHIVGPPGCGKTELLRAYFGHPICVPVSQLTENSLISGTNDDAGNDPSLIAMLNGKVLSIKDLTPLIREKKDKVHKVFGDLRDAFDGECSKSSGMLGLRKYVSSFGCVTCVTPILWSLMEDLQQAGERFLILQMKRYPANHDEAVNHLKETLGVSDRKEKWRADLRLVVYTALEEIRTRLLRPELPNIPERHNETLILCSYIVSQLRTIQVGGAPVDPESGNRIGQQLRNIGLAHAYVDNRMEWGPLEDDLVRRITIDTLGKKRRRVLQLLHHNYTSKFISTAKSIQQGCGAETTVGDVISILNQFHYMDVVTAEQEGDDKLFTLHPAFKSIIDRSGLLVPGPHMPYPTKVKALPEVIS